jgi:hypothetical protein
MRPVVLYVDYENLRHWPADAYADLPTELDVVRLGELISSRRHEESFLMQVRVYRGIPNHKLDAARARRQRSWFERRQNDKRFVLISQPLKYRWDGRTNIPVEKGIDVALAIDLAMHPFRFPTCVAVLLSRDQDFQPAIEAFVEFAVGQSPLEVASCPPLSRLYIGATKRPWCHYLSREDFEAIRDDA